MKSILPKQTFLQITTPQTGRMLSSLLILLLFSHQADGAESTALATNAVPSVVLHLPLALIGGKTNALQLRGLHLTNITGTVLLSPADGSIASFRSAGKADIPKPLDAARAGDNQVLLDLFLPTSGSSTSVVVTLERGHERVLSRSIEVLEKGRGVDEKEPNNGFKQSQPLTMGQTVRGVIDKERDVDVYRFDASEGDRIHLAIRAASMGSALDSVLTLSSATGHTLAWNDDAGLGMDSEIRFKIPSSGTYFVTVMDAHDRGGSLHAYLLSLVLAPK